MKRQSTDGFAAQTAELAVTGAEIVAAGVVLTAGIVLAVAELIVAKVFLGEQKRVHAA